MVNAKCNNNNNSGSLLQTRGTYRHDHRHKSTKKG